jgi:hypothetical protein
VGALVALRGHIFSSATTAEPDPPSTPDPRPAPPPALPDKVTVDLQGLPEGAEVQVDGVPAGALPLKLPRGDRRHQLLVRAPGRQPRAIEIDGTRDRVVELELAPVPEPTTNAAPRASETTAVSRKSAREEKARARDARRRGAADTGRHAVTGASEPEASPPPPADSPPPPKPNPPKAAHTAYDEM